MFQATELAIKTSENAKREYLANAVLNSLTCPFEESVVMMFFSMIGKYTLWHLKILDFFQNPKKFKKAQEGNYYMGSRESIGLYRAASFFFFASEIVASCMNRR